MNRIDLQAPTLAEPSQKNQGAGIPSCTTPWQQTICGYCLICFVKFVPKCPNLISVGRDAECIESALASGIIRGEANLLRFFCRHFNLIGYETSSVIDSVKIDSQLDTIHTDLFWGDEKSFSKKLEELVKKDEFLGGRGGPNAADFLAFSALDGKKQSSINLQNWAKKCKAAFA